MLVIDHDHRYLMIRRIFIIIILVIICKSKNGNCYLGIDWGRYASQRMIPSMVVDILLQNGIEEVKLFSTSCNVLEAFSGTNIGVTVTIPNESLFLMSQDINEAKNWIRTSIIPFLQRGVNIRYVTVGAEPYSNMYFNVTYYEALGALSTVQKAFSEIDLGGKVIKVTMNHFTDILNQVTIPSKGDFNEDIKNLMIQTCKILNETDSPIFLDMFPIYNAKMKFNDIEFAFFDNNSTSSFMDGDYLYKNIFEVMYDTLVYALEKNGFPNMKIVVGQLGWPTDGIDGASLYNAERFYRGFLKFHYSGKGTPRRPGPIDTYLYNLADENKMPIQQGAFLRHWGIYRFDGEPKFNIDFAGKGRDIKIISVKGITHMPKRWCVYNNRTHDVQKLQRLFDEACSNSDCTSLAPGGSCGNLGFPLNISYAFNMMFQMKSQKVSDDACQFDGLGMIVPDDPSTNTCKFPVEILSSEKATNGNVMDDDSKGGNKKSPTLIMLGLTFILLELLLQNILI